MRRLGGVEGGEEGAFGFGLGEAGVGVEGILDAVLPFLLGEDVHGALVAGEEVRAVVGGEEGLQRADAGDEEDEVVLAAELEGGVDDVVADAFGAEVDLEAVGEEGEEVNSACPTCLERTSTCLIPRGGRRIRAISSM